MTSLQISAPHLTADQVARLSNIFDNAGQVALGGLVFAPLIAGFDSTRVLVLLSGIVTVLLCWLTSLWLAKKRKEFYEI